MTESAAIKVHNAQPYQYWPVLNCTLPDRGLICFKSSEDIGLTEYLKMLAQHEPPYAGELHYADDIKISYLDESINLVSVLPAFHNLTLAPEYYQLADKNTIHQQADALLLAFHCMDVRNLLPAFMTAIKRRLLLILRELMLSPAIFFIAKPFYGLSCYEYKEFTAYLLKLVHTFNITLLCSDVPTDFIDTHASYIIEYENKHFDCYAR